MGNIVISNGMRANLNALQSTAQLMSTTQNRLATGNKVNSALDNPTSFFTAQNLNNRSGDLGSLLDDQANSIQTIKAASNGIDGIGKLVTNLKSVANQAQQANTSATTLTSSTITPKDYSSTPGSLVVTSGGKDTTIALSSNITSAADLKTAIDGASIDGLTVTDNGDGTLGFSDASGHEVSFSGGAAADLGISADKSTNGTNLDSYVKQYNDLLDQIDTMAGDSSYNGVNLLQTNNDLTVKFNETGSSTMTIKSADMSSSGINLSAVTADDWSTKAGINSSLDAVNSAQGTLRTQSSTFGSNLSVVQTRTDFTKGLQSVLTDGADGLTQADTNAESANLLALQTRQSLAISSMSATSQSEQGILRILG